MPPPSPRGPLFQTDPPLKYIDYLTFPHVVGELVRDNAGFAGVHYSGSFPRKAAELPAIAYRLARRVPGMDGVETRKPRLRGRRLNEDGSWTEIWSQWMTCIYQFDVCHTTGEEAEQLAWQFDHLMRESVGIFLTLGASEVVFDEQVEDQLLKPVEDIAVRSLRWLARLESLEFRTLPSIAQVRVRVFSPQDNDYEAVVRGADTAALDWLKQTYVSKILYVSDPSASGIARAEDYLPGVDFETVYDPVSARTALVWLVPGKQPAPGATYYVRYLHWTAFTRQQIPLHTGSTDAKLIEFRDQLDPIRTLP